MKYGDGTEYNPPPPEDEDDEEAAQGLRFGVACGQRAESRSPFTSGGELFLDGAFRQALRIG
jgi:hypothetical protein